MDLFAIIDIQDAHGKARREVKYSMVLLENYRYCLFSSKLEFLRRMINTQNSYPNEELLKCSDVESICEEVPSCLGQGTQTPEGVYGFFFKNQTGDWSYKTTIENMFKVALSEGHKLQMNMHLVQNKKTREVILFGENVYWL
jgi:hypothetical protein